METDFRQRIDQHVTSLPAGNAKFQKFNTNPFVLMFHCMKQGYQHIRELEHDILPAKLFMSMETSAGRMVETVTLPVYGWQPVASAMHSSDSVLDGKKVTADKLFLATLKSGPRCLNDEMSKDIADDIISNCKAWADSENLRQIDFTYGVLYGSQKLSNKKDWHILRNVAEKLIGLPDGHLVESPDHQWHCRFSIGDLDVVVTVRIGVDLWNFIGAHDTAFIELCSALIRACVTPTDTEVGDYEYTIADLSQIVDTECVPEAFNVSLLQRSQFAWLFFLARHFCDELTE